MSLEKDGFMSIYSVTKRHMEPGDGQFLTQVGFGMGQIDKNMLDQNENNELLKKLPNVKKQRVIIEKNFTMLQNRVQLLEMEERKAQKILDNTKKRTIEIITNKNMHSERHKLNEEVKKREEDRVAILKMENQLKKDLLRQNLQMTRIKMVQKVRSDADLMKSLKGHFKQHHSIIQEELCLRNSQSYQYVKFQEKINQQKRKYNDELKRKVANNDYQKKIQNEVVNTLKIKEKYQSLEEKESELLKRLKLSQNLQKQAYDQMEKVIMWPGDNLQKTQSSFHKTGTNFKDKSDFKIKTNIRSYSHYVSAEGNQNNLNQEKL